MGRSDRQKYVDRCCWGKIEASDRLYDTQNLLDNVYKTDKSCHNNYKGDRRYRLDTCMDRFHKICGQHPDMLFKATTCKEWGKLRKETRGFKEGEKRKRIVCLQHGTANISNNKDCQSWCDGKGSDFCNALKDDYCKVSGRASQDPFCIDWCKSMHEDHQWDAFARNCDINKWQQGWCSRGDKIFSDTVCQDLCDLNKASATDRIWCTNKRKQFCADQYNALQDSDDTDGLRRFVDGKDSDGNPIDPATDPLVLKGKWCACYMPERVYDDNIALMKKTMNTNAMVDTYLNTNKRCLFKPCAVSPSYIQPEVCPPIAFCVQQVDINITDSTVTGNTGVDAAQSCLFEVQNTASCQYTVSDWRDCIDGIRERTRTLLEDTDYHGECKPIILETEPCGEDNTITPPGYTESESEDPPTPTETESESKDPPATTETESESEDPPTTTDTESESKDSSTTTESKDPGTKKKTEDTNGGLSKTAIAAIAVGICILLLLIAGGVFVMYAN